MARPILGHVSNYCGSLPIALALFVSVSALVALCARHARQTPKQASKRPMGADLVPRSKHLVANISSKAITFIQKKGGGGHEVGVRGKEDQDGGLADGGLWQKAILMGEKCQPLEFSGVIYYDSYGNQLAEPPVPRSPRASPLHALSFPAAARGV